MVLYEFSFPSDPGLTEEEIKEQLEDFLSKEEDKNNWKPGWKLTIPASEDDEMYEQCVYYCVIEGEYNVTLH